MPPILPQPPWTSATDLTSGSGPAARNASGRDGHPDRHEVALVDPLGPPDGHLDRQQIATVLGEQRGVERGVTDGGLDRDASPPVRELVGHRCDVGHHVLTERYEVERRRPPPVDDRALERPLHLDSSLAQPAPGGQSTFSSPIASQPSPSTCRLTILGVAVRADGVSATNALKWSLFTCGPAPSSVNASTSTNSQLSATLRDHSNHRLPGSLRVASVNGVTRSIQVSTSSGLTGNLTTMKYICSPPFGAALSQRAR